jgi:hypothetical protein
MIMTHKFYLPAIFLFLSAGPGVVAQMVYKGSAHQLYFARISLDCLSGGNDTFTFPDADFHRRFDWNPFSSSNDPKNVVAKFDPHPINVNQGTC